MVTLRSLIPRRVARSLEALVILDLIVEDPLWDERIQRIHAQVTAAYLLRTLLIRLELINMNDPLQRETSGRLDLLHLANVAHDNGIIDQHEWLSLIHI